MDDGSGLALLEEGASCCRVGPSLDGRRRVSADGRRVVLLVDDEDEAIGGGGTDGLDDGGDGDLLLRGSEVLRAGPIEDLLALREGFASQVWSAS